MRSRAVTPLTATRFCSKPQDRVATDDFIDSSVPLAIQERIYYDVLIFGVAKTCDIYNASPAQVERIFERWRGELTGRASARRMADLASKHLNPSGL